MLRDNLVGLTEPMLGSARELTSLALLVQRTSRKSHRTIDPECLENPRPRGRNLPLTENVASPFHAEPKQYHTVVQN
jgi:hypothetical protein